MQVTLGDNIIHTHQTQPKKNNACIPRSSNVTVHVALGKNILTNTKP